MIQQQNGNRRRFSTAVILSLSLSLPLVALLLGRSSTFVHVDAFHLASMISSPLPSSSLCFEKNDRLSPVSSEQPNQQYQQHQQYQLQQHGESLSRRGWLSKAPQVAAAIVVATTSGAIVAGLPASASASDPDLGEITNKVFVDVSGLSASASAETGKTQRIVVGLFGKDAPASSKKLLLLHDTSLSGGDTGLPAPCKPLKEDFLIQREQLEANKIYRSCVEGQKRGVTYDYAQIWRIIKDERIDFGSLSGKFNAREYPTWAEKSVQNASDYVGSSSTTLPADCKYLVAVRKGSDSGFGYTLFPTATVQSNQDFLENYIVVGRVLEGEDVVDQINNISVVASAKSLNYMSIVGGGGSGSKNNNAPKKDCRYGGPMYCNENKPLTKLTMFRTGIL